MTFCAVLELPPVCVTADVKMFTPPKVIESILFPPPLEPPVIWIVPVADVPSTALLIVKVFAALDPFTAPETVTVAFALVPACAPEKEIDPDAFVPSVALASAIVPDANVPSVPPVTRNEPDAFE